MRDYKTNYTVGAVFLAVTLFGGLIYFAIDFDHQQTKHYAQIPIEIDVASFERELDALQLKVVAPYQNAQEYFAVVKELDSLELKANKLDAISPRKATHTARGPLNHSRNLDVRNLVQANTNRMATVYNLNFDAFTQEREMYTKQMVAAKNVFKNFSWDPRPILYFLLIWHLIGCGLLAIHFQYRLEEQECSLFPELLTGKFVFAVLFWEAAFWFYPNTTPEEQWRAIRRAASYMFGTIVSITGGVIRIAAQNAAPAPATTTSSKQKDHCTPKLSGNVQAISSFVGPDGAVFSAHPTMQQSLTLSCGNYYATLFGSRSLVSTNGHPSGANEIDLILGTAREVNGVFLDVNIGHIAGSPLRNHGDDLFKIGFSLTGQSFQVGPVSIKPTGGVDTFIPFKKKHQTGGVLGSVGVNAEVPLHKKLSIALNPRVVYDDGAFGFQPTVVGVINGGLNIKLNDHITVQPLNFQFSSPLKHVTDPRQTQWVAGSSLSFAF